MNRELINKGLGTYTLDQEDTAEMLAKLFSRFPSTAELKRVLGEETVKLLDNTVIFYSKVNPYFYDED